MTSRLIRDLRHAAIEDPEFAWQYGQIIERLQNAERHPASTTPMIDRTSGWKQPVAICRLCGPDHRWHGTPCDHEDCGCDTSCMNLREG
jgi:hypothetical protein